MSNLIHYDQFVTASRAAGFTDLEILDVFLAIHYHQLAISLLQDDDTGEQRWLIERPGAWPPQNWLIADWLHAYRTGEIPAITMSTELRRLDAMLAEAPPAFRAMMLDPRRQPREPERRDALLLACHQADYSDEESAALLSAIDAQLCWAHTTDWLIDGQLTHPWIVQSLVGLCPADTWDLDAWVTDYRRYQNAWFLRRREEGQPQ